MGGSGWRTLTRLALIAVLMVFGGVAGASAAVPESPQLSAAALKAKVARVESFRIDQSERDAAAARMNLQKKIAQLAGGVGSSALVAPSASIVPSQGGIPDYFGSTPNWAFSPPLRKFVDGMPGLGAGGVNNLGQFISVAKPDTTTYPGSDYYEIELRQFTEQMHSDLPPTTLRGYVQVNKGTDEFGNNTIAPDPIQFFGPFITATKNRPVRIKFTNKLPTGEAGDLFIPVDTSVMGAGDGPIAGESYTQNRGLLHLHGGITPWISDGTPHQWVTPAGENTPYPKGVSVKNVPDMPDPGPGSMTLFYTNQQSARLMFYHDHSFGITRLNVYAGEAAGYMITDDAEKALIASGTIPADQIPVIVQDKTFVDEDTVLTTDPTWNWGTGKKDANGIRAPKTGDLWIPHVYVPAQNPADLSGMNATGRWHYGPWFWPPIPADAIAHPPIPNPYYDPINAPWEPSLMPATPNPSMGMEAYHDTAMVNGTAYPVLEVDPKSYRMRILNASDDRFWNLQMYVADPAVTTSDGRKNTEVKMVPAVETSGFPDLWPADGRVGGVPDPATAGPEWIQIATESGFLPKPAIIPQQPISWITDPTMFRMGNVQDHSLLLGPAERADVVVDFSAYAGKTLILYNDSPTAFPALDARTDYFTGMPDMTDTGGPAGTLPGFGSNTRTIMQIKVAATPAAAPFDLTALEDAFASNNERPGVFKASQNPIHVPDARYDSAYNDTFTADPYVRIYQNEMTFQTLDSRTVTMPLEPKAIQDETSEVWDLEYGRMSGKIGVEMPRTNATNANFVLYGYSDPVVEYLQDSMTPLSPIGEDGTQIWKITHNGVDTHPIHFHLFDVQLINRVGWDNAVTVPDDNELGWKDTVRVSPLEDTIVALKPVAPKLDFGVPDSVRPLNPTLPLNSMMGFSNINPLTGQAYPAGSEIKNVMTNFGWEYVWHCHILSHEEMDMMRPMSLAVARSVPDSPTLAANGLPGSPIDLAWTDGTPVGDPGTLGNPANEVGFRVERATVTSQGVESTYTVLGIVPANQTNYQDNTTVDGKAYRYIVYAFNAATAGIASNAVTVSPPAFFDTYVITPMAGVGGTISPSTPQGVPVGSDSPTFTITPEPGYTLVDVMIDGVSVGTGAEYKFFNVTADHALWALFAKDAFTITPSAGAHGNISPSWDQIVDRGTDSTTFTMSPNMGYHVADVMIDGVSIGVVDSYTFTNVLADHTIDVSFALNMYTITPTAGSGGTITPSTPQMVNWSSDSPTFTIAPLPGNYISSVKIDGVNIGPITEYAFKNVRANHTLDVTFGVKIIYRYAYSKYWSALSAAKAAYPGWAGVTDVVIAAGDSGELNLFEAATAPGLAGAYGAPLLLSDPTILRNDLRDALIAMPDGVKVHLVGRGVSTPLRNAIARIPGVASVDRLYGADRFGTSVAVARRMKLILGSAFPDTALVASAQSMNNIWDSVVASPVSARQHYPLLFVNTAGVPTDVGAALYDLGLSNRYILGGTGAVPETVRSALGVDPANRIGGADAYATSALFAQRAVDNGWLSGGTVGFASNPDLADWAGAYMGVRGGPILYVRSTSVPGSVATYLTANSTVIKRGYVFGATSTLSEAVRLILLDLIK